MCPTRRLQQLSWVPFVLKRTRICYHVRFCLLRFSGSRRQKNDTDYVAVCCLLLFVASNLLCLYDPKRLSRFLLQSCPISVWWFRIYRYRIVSRYRLSSFNIADYLMQSSHGVYVYGQFISRVYVSLHSVFKSVCNYFFYQQHTCLENTIVIVSLEPHTSL